jgi:segregation and condensation protein A
VSYQIKIENFEGPLDLLLYFIRRDELDIYDIPISQITKDFISVISEWKRLNLIIAGDFIVMASTLMRVKAKMLIPRPELDDDGIRLDPREELINQLIDYSRFKDAASFLKQMNEESSLMTPRQFQQSINPDSADTLNLVLEDITLFDIASYFKKVMEKRPIISQFELSREPIKLEQQKEIILKRLNEKGRLSFKNLTKKIQSKLELIVTFLAILDLIRVGICHVVQDAIFGELELIKVQEK